MGTGRDHGHITAPQETEEQSVYQITLTPLTCGGCVQLGGTVCRADQDSALFSLGTRAGGVLPQRAHGGFRAAQGLRGQGRASSQQVGLSQQGCVFPGAGTWARRGKNKLPSGKLGNRGPSPANRASSSSQAAPPSPGPSRVGPLTITGFWLQLFLSIQGLLIWFLLLRQLALCNQPQRGFRVSLEEPEGSGGRDGGSTIPVPEGSSGLSPPSVMSPGWDGSSWPWGGGQGRAREAVPGWQCLSSDPQLTGWCRSPLCPQLLLITFTWLMGREASLGVLSGMLSLSFSDVYLWRRNH